MVDEVVGVSEGLKVEVTVTVLFAMKSQDFEAWIQRKCD